MSCFSIIPSSSWLVPDLICSQLYFTWSLLYYTFYIDPLDLIITFFILGWLALTCSCLFLLVLALFYLTLAWLHFTLTWLIVSDYLFLLWHDLNYSSVDLNCSWLDLIINTWFNLTLLDMTDFLLYMFLSWFDLFITTWLVPQLTFTQLDPYSTWLDPCLNHIYFCLLLINFDLTWLYPCLTWIDPWITLLCQDNDFT